jgi:hypothetical protein
VRGYARRINLSGVSIDRDCKRRARPDHGDDARSAVNINLETH